MALSNECIPYYEETERLTGHAAGTIVGKRYVKITGWQTGGGPGLSGTPQGTGTGGEGANMTILQAGAADLPDGVAFYDAASGTKIGFYTIDAGFILPITAGEAITVGSLVMVGAGGKAFIATTGNHIVGKAVKAASGADVDVIVRCFHGGKV